MLPKQTIAEIQKREQLIKLRKERIDKLKVLSKIKNNELISEYDNIIKQSDDTITSILESNQILDAHAEQVMLRSAAKVRLMAKGLKASICNPQTQIDALNNMIEDENIYISNLKEGKKTSGGII